MGRSSGKPLFFDGTNYPYWKIRMSAYLQSLGSREWEICEDATYVMLETVDAMFSRFQLIVNKMWANKPQLLYDNHERALKLLYVLYRRVWDVKVSAIIESPNYDTLTVDELFSKLKSTEIDHQTRAKLEDPFAPTMALVSGNGGSSSLTNPSQASFALSSLMSVTEEQMEALGDDELALVISRFSWFHNNCLNHRRGDGPKDGCYGCGDLNHFVTHCPKKNKDSFGKHKLKGGFDKEAIKKEFLEKAKAHKDAFHDCLSDLEKDSTDSDSSTSNDNESIRKIKDKLSELYFHTDTAKQGFCTMALGDEVVSDDNEAHDNDSESEVCLSTDELFAENEKLSAALISQDKLLKCAARKRKEYKDKLEVVLTELEAGKKCAVDKGPENMWFIDSGCLRHMTKSLKWFSSLNPMQCKEYITFGDNQSLGKLWILYHQF
ncbi:uncharacterized protein [Miscanthus floridulus]|uniref:uncharacterized protein n=1 Tax=Miscanthus floridulus TaxID=154761 RepID=UPI003459BAF0